MIVGRTYRVKEYYASAFFPGDCYGTAIGLAEGSYVVVMTPVRRANPTSRRYQFEVISAGKLLTVEWGDIGGTVVHLLNNTFEGGWENFFELVA